MCAHTCKHYILHSNLFFVFLPSECSPTQRWFHWEVHSPHALGSCAHTTPAAPSRNQRCDAGACPAATPASSCWRGGAAASPKAPWRKDQREAPQEPERKWGRRQRYMAVLDCKQNSISFLFDFGIWPFNLQWHHSLTSVGQSDKGTVIYSILVCNLACNLQYTGFLTS